MAVALAISALRGGMLGGMQALPGADACGQIPARVVRGGIRATGLMALADAGSAVWWWPR